MIEQFIKEYGLLAVFVGVILEGDATMILAGVAAHLRLLGQIEVLGVGVIGSWIGDAIWYAAGRFTRGHFKKKIREEAETEKVDRFTKRFGVWSIFVSRFIWGTRILTMSFWGYRRLSFARFAFVDLIGCFLWAVLLGGIGYFFSKSAEFFIGEVKKIEIWFLVSVILSVIIVLIVHILYKRSRARIGKA